MPASLLAYLNAVRQESDLAGNHVGGDRADQGQRDDREQPEAHEVEERQREDVERGVSADQRICLTERRCLQVLQHEQPLAGGHPADEERGQARSGQSQPGEMPALEHERLQVPAAREHHVGAPGALDGQAQVAEQAEERHEERGGPSSHRVVRLLRKTLW